MTSFHERAPAWGAVLEGEPAEVVEWPPESIADLLAAPIDELPITAGLPEQWEVVPDPATPPPPVAPPPVAAPLPVAAPPVVALPVTAPPPPAVPAHEPAPAVPAMHHVVEAPPAPPPVAPPAPPPAAPPPPAPPPDVLAPRSVPDAPDRGARTDEEPVAAPVSIRDDVAVGDRITSALVLMLLSVVVGIAGAGLIAAVVLAVVLAVRRALGS